MKKTIFALSLTALAASTAFAQAPASADPSAAVPVSPVTRSSPAANVDPATAISSPASPGKSGSPADNAAAAQATQTSTATPDATTATGSQVAAVVDASWAKYDADGNGTLSAAEFKLWISDLKTQELSAEGKPTDAASVKQYAGAALKSADKDNSHSVSKAELTTFLGG